MSRRERTKVQAATLLLEARMDAGLTWKELSTTESMGHGSASRVLSDMHRTNHACRLVEQRDGCAVYVLPQYVAGRELVEQNRRRQPDREDAAAMAGRVLGVVERWGLDSSASASMHALAADLRRAVNRTNPDDVLTLGGDTPT